MDIETENREYYKYSENGIKNRNYNLWNKINMYVNHDISFKEKFYLFENKIDKVPLCECGNRLKFIDMISGYRMFCSKKCVLNSNDIKEKRKKTNIEKYGVDNPSKSLMIKDRVKKTNNIKFGCDWATQNDSIKEKSKSTSIEKYGVDNPSKVSEVREKAKKTMMDRYGVEYAMHSDRIKEDLKLFFLEKYGVDNPSKVVEVRKKAEDTMLSKYGVRHALQNTDLKNKFEDTIFKRYGVKSLLTNKDILEKRKKTNIEKYGFDNPAKSDVVKEKIKESVLFTYENNKSEILEKRKKTNIEKYEISHISKNNDYRLKYKISNHPSYIRYIDNGISLFSCDNNLDHNFTISVDNYYSRSNESNKLCTICNPISSSSSMKEDSLFKFIKSIYKGNVIPGYRDELEIDIYLPELNIGFEFNGLYWHSEQFKDKNYHLDKTNFFKERGIRIIHIWEDDWSYKQDIIKSQIRNWINLSTRKIYARKCYVKEVDTKTTKDFLNKNHIQGYVNSKLSIGLFLSGELVSLMTFDDIEGRNRMLLNNWNLSRFCNLLNTNVIGGSSKLLSFFIKKYNPNRIISYADKDWSSGNLYSILGFNEIKETKPDYKYINEGKRVHKSRFKKSKLGIKNESMTESEYTKSIGINRIYDCGKIKFEWTNFI